MNIFLWVMQGVLAFLYLAGGAYKTFSFQELASQMPAIPHGGWRALGVIEMLGALMLIIPAALRWLPMLTPLAAVVLMIETLALSAVYAHYSLKLTATNPLVWSVAMAILVAFVAYGRYAIRPPV